MDDELDELFPRRMNWDHIAEQMRELIDEYYRDDPLERDAAHKRVAAHCARMKLRDTPH